MRKFITISLFLISTFFSGFAQLSSTNLPILKIQTTQAIVDTYAQAQLEIIDNVSGTNNIADPATLTSNIGIKLRGDAATQGYPKKSYSVETWTGFNISNNISPLGLPTENDWVLLAAYPDRSLLRGKLLLEIHDDMDRYAPRLKYCELMVDNIYQGVYLFGEKIKRDSARLDIANLRVQDNFGDELTGGYILNVDNESGGGFISGYAPPYALGTQQVKFLYEYPDNGDITPAQEAYIKSYVDSFEDGLSSVNFQDTLQGWRPFGANNAFIDYILANEVAKNYEAYRIDMYLYKDKLKKMRPGPLWGGDAAFANTASCLSHVDTGWAYKLGALCGNETNLPSFWWEKLMTDTLFVKDLVCRYHLFRQVGQPLDKAVIFAHIDSFSNLLNAQGAQSRNFTTYPIFGISIINEPQPMAVDYAAEVTNLKTFIEARLNWLDAQWVNTAPCFATAVNDLSLERDIAIYPNPAHNVINVSYAKNAKVHYHLTNMAGQELLQGNGYSLFDINVSELAAGMYLLHLEVEGKQLVRKVGVQ
jgi:hypothetical protein